jgi:hypothetical protein
MTFIEPTGDRQDGPDCSAPRAARLAPGQQVRLCPREGADIFDLMLRGKIATITSLEENFDGQAYVAVTVDDDPGRDFRARLQQDHRFFFRFDEVETLEGPNEPHP